MPKERASDYDEKRQAILAGAAQCFAEGGYDGTSMSRVAAACGVSKALLYHYYTNKETLLLDILEAHLTDLVETVEAAAAAPIAPCSGSSAASPACARLERLCIALLGAYQDADAEHRVQIDNLERLPAARQEELKTLERQLVTIFAETIAAAHPGLDEGSPLLKPLTMSLFGMLNWHYMWFRNEGPMTRHDYAHVATRLILDGAAKLVSEKIGLQRRTA